jgi:glycosyltransferase involved in cell wall biosynthesis
MSEPLSVVIPAYNEAAIVGKVVNSVSECLTRAQIPHEVIVVDDGSQDGTAEAAGRTAARVIRHRSNRGYGASLKTGISAAQYRAICITDADGTYPVSEIPRLYREFAAADMVVGARVGAKVAIPLMRRPAKWVLNRLADYVTATKIPDLNSGLRIFDREIAFQYFNILSDQFSFTTTITMAMLCDKYAVKYVPINYGVRTGRSKIVAWDAANFMVLIVRIAMLFRPLRVFMPAALLFFLYAMIKAPWDLLITGDRNVSTTAAVAMICAVQLLLIGMLGDALATRLRNISGTANLDYGATRGMPLRNRPLADDPVLTCPPTEDEAEVVAESSLTDRTG